MKYRYIVLVMLVLLILAGCGGQTKKEVEQAIYDAFRARADAVFLHKDQKVLNQYFSAGALEKNGKYLGWSPNGSWDNKKDPAYKHNLRIDHLKVDGKRATADVYETVLVSWDYIDAELVSEQDNKKEDAWSGRLHKVVLQLSPDGRWIVEEDLTQE